MKLREVASVIAAAATLIAAIAASASVYVAINTQQAVYEVHLQLNSRLDQLVKETRRAAHAAGVEEGRDETEEPEKHDDRDDRAGHPDAIRHPGRIHRRQLPLLDARAALAG